MIINNSNALNIVVNATALRTSGALIVLKQFLKAIPIDNYLYIIFIDESVQLETSSNVKMIPLNKRSFFKRFLWDACGLRKWLQKNNIKPYATISLQNTNFRVDGICSNYIYYHQPMPFYPYKWSPFKPKERTLWFYKNIYPFFVKLFINSKTEIFVQLNYIKEEFVKKYNINQDKIHVVFPKIEIPKPEKKSQIVIDKQKFNFFYPATPFIYKNHVVLFNAFSLIDSLLSKKIVLYLTCNKEDLDIEYSFENIEIIYLGLLPHNEVIWVWEEVNGCLFPSYIETLGLPLIEAASVGKPIIASDLAYSKEVLEGYNGASFVDYQDAKAWGNEILKLISNPTVYTPLKKESKDSWNEFFKIIKSKK